LPKRITNPIREGLPSKIYLLAFYHPVSGYQIAKRIYDVEKYPPTAKVMEWLKKLVKNEIIAKTDEGFLSNIKPLVDEIAITLKEEHNVDLNEFEKYVAERFLDFIRIRIVNHERIKKKGYFKRDVDSARELMEQFGNYMMIEQLLSVRDFNLKTKAEFDEKWLQFRQGKVYEKEGIPITDLIPSELRLNFFKLSPLYVMFQKIESGGLTFDLFELWLNQDKIIK
jgi:hypothetical protein